VKNNIYHSIFSAEIKQSFLSRKRRWALFVVRHSLKAKTRNKSMAMQLLLFGVFYE